MSPSQLDFQDTEIAFSSKSDEELKKTARLFGLMNKRWLVNIGSSVGMLAFRLRLPLLEPVVRRTIYQQFVGGRTLLECMPAIAKLHEYGVGAILDYGAEAKDSEEEFNITMNEVLRSIDFAATLPNVPVVSAKITGLTHTALLEKMHAGDRLDTEEEHQYQSLLKRVDVICNRAMEKAVALFIDAEETWIQDPIDDIVDIMMHRYNKQRPVVYNTYQMYRSDRLAYLHSSYEKARVGGYILGAKIVRGAYMDKERKRAADKGLPSPIQPDKAATDRDYNAAISFCVAHYEQIASCNATHNAASSELQAELIGRAGLPKDHPHFMFCQLYGMSDNITFNLAKAGYRSAKYMPYGPVHDVMPYLIRRTQENAAVTGDMSREYKLILREMKRRGI